MSDQPGYFAVGRCYVCATRVMFNPSIVPSVPVDQHGKPALNGTRVPLCRECAEAANVARAAEGRPQWTISDEAYAPAQGLPE